MRILFLGAPGAGKGTQCQRLSAELQVPHLSSGDLLRLAVKNGTAAGVAAKSYMDKGVLVPDNVLIDMFRERLGSPACANGFILDGFPRNLPQAESLNALLEEIKAQLTCVICLEVDEKLLKDRITGRRTCTNKECAAVYHVKFSPPAQEGICDKCGGPLSQRADDKEELVQARLSTYHEQTAPLIEYYGQKGILSKVTGEGDQDHIFAAILQSLKGNCVTKK